MGLWQRIRRSVILRKYRSISAALRRADPLSLQRCSEQLALQAFHRAARRVPAYAELLARRGIRPADVRSIEDFRARVPVLDKDSVFGSGPLGDLCAGGTLRDARAFFCSSGSTGRFSYGVETRKEQRQGARALEFGLEHRFAALSRRTLLINCLPMGVKVPSDLLAVADTGVRADVVWALVRKLRGEFEQFILVGEQLFLKKVIEEGPDHDVNWPALRVHVITGAEYVAESFRDYISALLGADPRHESRSGLHINYGLSELSLSIGRECPESAPLRRLAREEVGFRAALTDREEPALPVIMQYVPVQTYLEVVRDADGRPELVVSLLDASRSLPLIRYNTHDMATLLPHGRLARLLQDAGREELLPRDRLPLAIVRGKMQPLRCGDGKGLYPEEVKECLYSNRALAAKATGRFHLHEEADGPHLDVQLRPGFESSPEEARDFSLAVGAATGISPALEFTRHADYLPGMTDDFERKHRYVV